MSNIKIPVTYKELLVFVKEKHDIALLKDCILLSEEFIAEKTTVRSGNSFALVVNCPDEETAIAQAAELEVIRKKVLHMPDTETKEEVTRTRPKFQEIKEKPTVFNPPVEVPAAHRSLHKVLSMIMKKIPKDKRAAHNADVARLTWSKFKQDKLPVDAELSPGYMETLTAYVLDNLEASKVIVSEHPAEDVGAPAHLSGSEPSSSTMLEDEDY